MTQATAVAVNPRTSGRRRVLSGFVLFLACLTILVTTVAVWTHQVALNTDRFTSLVRNAVTEPAVTDPIATRITDQVIEALDVQGRLEARLPDAIKPLAGSLEAAVAERIDARLKIALRDPRLQNALIQTMSFTHAQLVRLLRGETENLSIVDGYLTLDAFPVVGAALTELQSMGLIPANVQLPDLSAPDAPEVLAQRLDSALGVTLPPDFGTIRLMPVARLATAQNVVRIFDLVVIVLIVLSALLVALALWLAPDRRRMLIYLGIGVVIVFLLARLAMNAARNVIIGGIADGDVRGAAQTIVDSTLRDLRGVTVLIIIATVIVVIAAYLWGRPRVGHGHDRVRDRHGRTRRLCRRCRRERGRVGRRGTRSGSRDRRTGRPREPLGHRAIRAGDRRVHPVLAGSWPGDRAARRCPGGRVRADPARPRRSVGRRGDRDLLRAICR